MMDVANNRPLDTAFDSGDSNRLSVLDADQYGPCVALLHLIGRTLEDCVSGKPSKQLNAKKRLDRIGWDVQDLYDHGWRVIKMPLSLFLDYGITVDPDSTIDKYGHFNLQADSWDVFTKRGRFWARHPDVKVMTRSDIFDAPTYLLLA
jgi:hypothetical protein